MTETNFNLTGLISNYRELWMKVDCEIQKIKSVCEPAKTRILSSKHSASKLLKILAELKLLTVSARIEIPQGDRFKTEYCDNFMCVDRLVDLPYPANYGAILNTRATDDDELDILIPSSNISLPRNTVVPSVAVGVLQMIDNGCVDDKVVGLPLFFLADMLMGASTEDYIMRVVSSVLFFAMPTLKQFGKDIEVTHFLPSEDCRHIIEAAEGNFLLLEN